MDMVNRRIDPQKQFSKRLARWTALFWFVYMLYMGTVMLLEPGTGIYAVYLSIICSVVMIVNVYSYCKNSIAEKVLLAILDKTQIELSLGSKAQADEDDGEEGEDGNDG